MPFTVTKKSLKTFIKPGTRAWPLLGMPVKTEEQRTEIDISVSAEHQVVVRSNLIHQQGFKISHHAQRRFSCKRRTTAWPSEMLKVARCGKIQIQETKQTNSKDLKHLAMRSFRRNRTSGKMTHERVCITSDGNKHANALSHTPKVWLGSWKTPAST